MAAPDHRLRVGGADYRSDLPCPPRRAGCSGDCQQGRAPCDCLDQREGLQRIDTLRRADCDPALPLGQDEPSEPRKLGRAVLDWIDRRFGWVALIVAVLAVSGALLTVHALAGQQERPEPARVPVVTTRGMV